MKTFALVIAALSLAHAQNPPTPVLPAPPVRRVVDVTHLTGDRAERAVKLVNQFMHPVGSMHLDPVLRTAILVGPEDVVKGAEALFSKFDTPNAVKRDLQVQFRFYLVEASPDPAGAGQVPPEIAAAVEQMKKSFVFQGYQLLDTILLQARGGGEAFVSGVLPARTERTDIRPIYDVAYRTADVLEDGKTVVLKNFRFRLRFTIGTPGGHTSTAESTITTDLTIQEGQKLVVGKLSSEQARNATFLIITVDVQ